MAHCAMISCGIILALGGGAVHGASPLVGKPVPIHPVQPIPALPSPGQPIPQLPSTLAPLAPEAIPNQFPNQRVSSILQVGYKSWSLFLISSPEWLLRQTKEKMNALYEQFGIFGNAIGDENLAVWFWSEPTLSGEDQRVVDVPRSVAICKRLKLKPSEGPYVVVMTEYPGQCVLTNPDSFPKDSAPRLVIKLNGNDAASTAHLLGDLAEKLLTENLSKLQSKSDDYWNGWRNVFTKVSTLVIGLSSKVTVAFNTGPVKTEVKLGP
jgi:hypothetical protein